eukprot:Hpha_TRINITY_DN36795_c0_g1::TRINITY_DN36795_c0_g1_i1::g.142151::m.142151
MTTERKGHDKDSPFSLMTTVDMGKKGPGAGWLRLSIGWDVYDMNPELTPPAFVQTEPRESKLVDVHIDATLGDLRRKIGRIGAVPEAALLAEGKAGGARCLFGDHKTLEELGIQDGDILLARNPSPPGSEFLVED